MSRIEDYRTQLAFHGSILCVVKNDCMASTLAKARFYQHPRDLYSFNQVSGHAVVRMPLTIQNLLTALREVHALDVEVWNDMLRTLSS